jgi:hypothetical protein
MWIETLYADNADRTLREHPEICRHIRARSAKAAEMLLKKHIGRAGENLVNVLCAQVSGVVVGTISSTATSPKRRATRRLLQGEVTPKH